MRLTFMLLKTRFTCLCILFFLAAGILGLPALAGRKEVETPRYGGTLRIKKPGLEFTPHFDPAVDPEILVMEQIYDGLVKLDKKMNLLPSLAEYWVISEDGRKYTFYLRKGVKFHHGKELDAQDVKFSFERLLDKKTDSYFFQYFAFRVAGAKEFWEGKAKEVKGFQVRDKYTFEIIWKYPYVSALYLLSMNFAKILPRDLVMNQGNSFFMRPSGTGPFKFANWLRSPTLDIVGVRLERNEEYFDQKAYLSAVEFSPHFTLDNFLNKDIHIIPYLSGRLSNVDCQVLESRSLNIWFLGMSCQNPPLDRASVRKAIALSIDKKRIAQSGFSFELVPHVTNNYILPQLPGFFPVDDKEGRDLIKAVDLLKNEGLVEGNGFPTILFLAARSSPLPVNQIYNELRDQLADVDIRLRLRYFRDLEEIPSIDQPYLFLFGWLLDFPDAENVIQPLFSTSSYMNLFDYSNPELDGLLGMAEVERSRKERISLFTKIEKILFADVPAIPLFSNQQRFVLQPEVRGVRLPPLGFSYLEAKEIWLAR